MLVLTVRNLRFVWSVVCNTGSRTSRSDIIVVFARRLNDVRQRAALHREVKVSNLSVSEKEERIDQHRRLLVTKHDILPYYGKLLC